MQHDAAHELDVEVAHPDRAAACLAAQREGFDQKVVEVLAFLSPLAQLVRPPAEGGVVERLELGLEAVDRRRNSEMALDLALVRVKKLSQAGH